MARRTRPRGGRVRERYDSFHCTEGFQLVSIEGPTHTRCGCEEMAGLDGTLPVREKSLNWMEGL